MFFSKKKKNQNVAPASLVNEVKLPRYSLGREVIKKLFHLKIELSCPEQFILW